VITLVTQLAFQEAEVQDIPKDKFAVVFYRTYMAPYYEYFEGRT
jgi:hypothetical protein